MEKRYRNVSGNVQGLDPKLKKAESNKVRLKVSQDGSAQFKSITEALNSIQPYNIRRVIISIAPGYYRYEYADYNSKLFYFFITKMLQVVIISYNL